MHEAGFLRSALYAALSSALVTLLAGGVPVTAAVPGSADPPKHMENLRWAGTQPLLVIEREELLRSGALSVADFLRALPMNSFGSFRPQNTGNYAELSLRGLGGARTLILIDGRRAPTSAIAGQGHDLNQIALAAVERVEILGHGASAIHGADAVAGVVNIVTRKNFTGVELSVDAGNPSREGGETEHAAVVFGTASERGSLVVGASSANRGIVFQRDRAWSRGGRSLNSNNFLNSSFSQPSGLTRNPTFGSVVPGGCDDPGFQVTGTGASARCIYDFSLIAADEVESRSSGLFARADYAINADWRSFLNASVDRSEGLAISAPAVLPGFSEFGQLLPIPVGSPNHPAVRFPSTGYDATRPYFVQHRFAAAGPREASSDNTAYALETGATGRTGVFDIDFGVRFVESKYLELGRNAIVVGNARAAVASGAYNLYDPLGNSAGVLDSITATTNREARYRAEELYANAAVDLFDLGGGAARLNLGAEHRDEQISDVYDTLTRSGQISGVFPRDSAAGARDVHAIHGQLLLPVSERFRFGLAARHDRMSDAGGESTARVNFEFEASSKLRLHASYGLGFLTPELSLQGIETTSAPGLLFFQDVIGPCVNPLGRCNVQFIDFSIANPELESEHSRHASIGLDWAPTAWLQIDLDYYNVEVKDRISLVSAVQIVSCLIGSNNPCPPGLDQFGPFGGQPRPELGLGVFGDLANGRVDAIQRGYGNLGTLDVSGADLSVATDFDLTDFGRVRNRLRLSWVHGFEDNGVEAVDQPSRPRQRAQLSNSWDLGDFSLSWYINYIHGTRSTAAIFGDGDYPARLSSWTTHDLQANWHAPWNGRFTLGIDNVADKDPVLDPYDPTGRGYDFALYDGYGRTPYFRYTQVL